MPILWTAGAGILIGLLNGLFGAGGGIAAVALFEKNGFSRKSAHATAVSIMLFCRRSAAFCIGSAGMSAYPMSSPSCPAGCWGRPWADGCFRKSRILG